MAALDTYLLCFIFIALRSTVPRSLKLKPQTMLIFWMESHCAYGLISSPSTILSGFCCFYTTYAINRAEIKELKWVFLFDTLVILFRLIGQWLKLQSLIGTWYQIYFPGSCLWEWLRPCIWLWAKPQDSSGWLCASNWPVQTCWLFSSQSGLLLLWRKGSTWLRYSDVPRTGYGLWQHPVSHLALSVGQKLIPCRFLSASFFWITFP